LDDLSLHAVIPEPLVGYAGVKLLGSAASNHIQHPGIVRGSNPKILFEVVVTDIYLV
jgi:hypothetical protein